LSFTANAAYVREKERCKELLDISKAKLDEVDEELRVTFQGMEEVCRHWFPLPAAEFRSGFTVG
jgi:hypothetical protein